MGEKWAAEERRVTDGGLVKVTVMVAIYIPLADNKLVAFIKLEQPKTSARWPACYITRTMRRRAASTDRLGMLAPLACYAFLLVRNDLRWEMPT